MNGKRMLTLLLALCMLMSVVSPAAAVTVQTGDDAVSNVGIQQAQNASGENTQDSVHSLRNETRNEVDIGELLGTNGQWTATETLVSGSILELQLPECVQELRALAETYSARERVAAFVVLEELPLINTYTSPNSVPMDEAEKMELQQEIVIETIEEDVLGGEELEIITRFTFLTNAIVIETEFENLEQIAAVDGVDTVFISPVFYPCETVDAQTVSSGQMTDVDAVWNLNDTGYTGVGMTIAVLDTGLDLDHPSFAAAPAGAAWSKDTVVEMLEQYDLNAETLYAENVGKTLTADDLYYSAKVPFLFNYALGTLQVGHDDGLSDHGTHVAGIAAANEVEGTGVVGMAPDAQIIVMKVFNSNTGGSNMYDLIAALEDCMKLDVDVVNMSLGSAAGFTSSSIAVIDAIFESIGDTDIIMDVAAGNEGTSAAGSLYGNAMNTTSNPDTSTVGSPSTYANSLSIASVDNAYVMASYFTLADGETKVYYQPSVERLYEYIELGMEDLAGQELEYVMVPNLGEEADFYDENGNSIVNGKVAVVNRGTISFAEKIQNAENAGAVAVVIWDNDPDDDIFAFGMSTSYEDEDGNTVYPGIPAALISMEDGGYMEKAAEKTMTVSPEDGLRISANGGQMSSFSSWGVSPDLGLVPDITGVGGNVYSCYDGGAYGLMSGTSMATPQVAGVTALVLQYLNELLDAGHDVFDDISLRELTDSLMMSTAVPVVDKDSGVEASPRQQGAGLVNALNAVTAEAYLTVSGSDRPKAELYDSATGTYSFTFTVHNFGDADKTYTLRSSLLCEDYATDEDYPGVYFMAEQDHGLDNSAVTFSKDTVTVPAGGTATVTVSIRLTDADKNWIDTYFPNGNYVEGFIYLESDTEVDLSLPFLGFYGSWYDAPVFDSGYWYEEGFWAGTYDDIVVDEVDANLYYHIPFVSLGSSDSDWVLGLNPYGGLVIDEDGYIVYSQTNNVLSPNGDGILDSITEYYLSLMRNTAWMTLTYTDEAGNVLDVEVFQKDNKTMYNSNYGSTVPFVYSWYYNDLYDFTDADGNYLPDGTKLTLTLAGCPAYGTGDVENVEDAVMTDEISIDIYIDTAAPVLDTQKIVESAEGTEEEPANFLTVTFADAHPAYVALMNTAQTQLYRTYADNELTDNGDGTWSIKIDITGLGTEFTLLLCDYGCNESAYELTFTANENAPNMDPDALYAYQIYDLAIYYYYGYDYMFGWSTLDKTTGEVTMLQSDAYEYYALTAAEYAGGYIFAVDAGYNLLYMVPGIWNRNVICNLGVNVLDMAFDETTQTMYLTTKTGDSYGLYTVDLLTGDLTLLKTYTSYYNMPWAMTFVDGQLYACRYYYSGLWKVDMETYELTRVLDSEGNTVAGTVSTGATSPSYSQSMTYSPKDGKIYWSYYQYSSSKATCELVAIDVNDWTWTSAPYEINREYVGLLTLEDDGYVIPESEEVTKMVISQEELILSQNKQETLEVTLLPWNAPVTENVVWSSSDETVAAVDQNGVVTSVSEGVAVITASYGGLSVSCSVKVVDVSGHLNAYKYYDGDYNYGVWLDIDLETVTEEATVESAVDFIAADYNGHNGKIYGYDEYGQAWCFDPETGDCVKLGSASLVADDMAYDYSTGLMYVLVNSDAYWTSTLYAMNMNSGALIEIDTLEQYYFMTLACSTDGQLYGIDYEGCLYALDLVDSATGAAAQKLTLAAISDKDASYELQLELVMEVPVQQAYYAQSMCYDHVNEVLLWLNTETSCIYWLEINDEEPFSIALGDPSGTGVIQYVGAYVVPNEEDIPPLEYVPVTGLSSTPLVLLEGQTKASSVVVYPANATYQDSFTWRSLNTGVATVDEDGNITGVAEGSTFIMASYQDPTDSTVRFSTILKVTVKKNTDNIYAHLMNDLATSGGYYWIDINDEEPENYNAVNYIYANNAYMLLYAAEHVDGVVYAYGFDYNDDASNFQFLKIDPKTWSVIGKAVDMGENFNFVYDMAFDYTTGTMYALAGPSDSNTDLYYVDIETGELILCQVLEPMFMSITVDAEGTIYVMDQSQMNDMETDYEGALLYTLDPSTGEYELFMDTGARSCSLSSMAYDYDTGYIYWTGLVYDYWNAIIDSGFYLIDPSDKTCNKLGTVGVAGSQVTGLMVLAEEYPEIPTTLTNMTLTSSMEELAVGDEVALRCFVLPASVDVELKWESADERVATVDENGVVTGVSAGTTEITVTVTDSEGNTMTDTCTIVVYGLDDYFIAYNTTDMGFAAIARPDSTKVTNLTSGENKAPVTAMAMVDGHIYAYDEDNRLFMTTVEDNFQRTYLGGFAVEVDEDYSEVVYSGKYIYDYTYEHGFVIRDMAWDEANQRMLALGGRYQIRYTTLTYPDGTVESYTDFREYTDGWIVYEVDLKTGELTKLVTVGGDETPLSGVMTLTADNAGNVFVYGITLDYIYSLDLETGAVSGLATFQRLSTYGSGDGDLMAMTFDPVSGDVYVLFTESGNNYKLFCYDVGTHTITLVDYVGLVNYSNYAYRGDTFAGLILNQEHGEREILDYQAPTCTEDGYVTYDCETCGTMTLEATGHSYESVATQPTCTEKGCTTHTCTVCGHSYTDSEVDARGHSYESVVTQPTCTEKGCTTHTCTVCGHSYTDSEVDALGHSYKSVVTAPTATEKGYTTHTCEVCGHSYVDSYVNPVDPNNPDTGDSFSGIWMLLLVLSAGTAVVLVLNRKRFL